MVILFLSNNLGLGGKERQIAEILRFLAKTTQNQYVLLLRENNVGFPVAGFSNLRVIEPQKRLSFLRFILFLKKVIKEIRPDIVHSWEGMVTLSAIIVRKTSGIKFKLIDGSLQYAKKYNFYSKTFIINKFNAILSDMVVSNSKAGLKAAGFQEKGKYHILPNGFDSSQFNGYENDRKNNRTLQMGMVAGFTVPKDFKSMVMASIRLFEEGYDFQVVFVGDGPEREDIELMIPDVYKNRFIFTGYLPTDEVLELVSKIDIGVLLSKKGHSEGMSNSIMEYMFFGIPVICTNTGGNPELIKNDYNGYLIPHEDVSILTEKMKLLIDDENKRIVMGDRSKKIAYEEFNIEKVTSKLLNLYNFLTEK